MNFGRMITISAGSSVIVDRKLIVIHRNSSSPISELKRMFENAHASVDTASDNAVNVTQSSTIEAQ